MRPDIAEEALPFSEKETQGNGWRFPKRKTSEQSEHCSDVFTADDIDFFHTMMLPLTLFLFTCHTYYFREYNKWLFPIVIKS